MGLKVAIDAHAIGQKLTGNEVYVRNLLARFAHLDHDAEFFTYIAEPEAETWIPRGFRHSYVSRNPFVRLGADLSARLRADKPDLVHVQYTAPLVCPVPIVVTVHDVSYFEHPEYFRLSRSVQLRLTTEHTLRRAAKIITISEYSRQRIAEDYNIDPAEIAVTPLAAEDCFRPLDRAAAASRVRKRFGIDRPYVLNVGDLHSRKNQIGLIRAFRQLLASHPKLPHLLVLAGKDTWFAPRVREEIRRQGLEERVVLTGFVDDEILPALYNAADLFVFPSLYEGYGLPVIEAMACGRPVVSSDATALPEVVDGAAFLFNPESIGEQVRAMRDILIDPELAQRMAKKSLQRAAFFDWRETARKTLAVYEDVAELRNTLMPRKELVSR